MGGNVALQCALHQDAKKYIRGIVVCSGHAGSYLLKKGKNFENYGNQILTGNSLHYGYCDAQKLYMQYVHSKKYRASKYNQCSLRVFYSYKSSPHPCYCCNLSANFKYDKHKQENQQNGAENWFKNLSIPYTIRVGMKKKHAVREGIERQTDIAEEGFDVAARVHNIFLPTLILYGEDDTVIDPNSALLLKTTIGDNATIKKVEHGGHNFWFENPQFFVEVIDKWMNVQKSNESITIVPLIKYIDKRPQTGNIDSSKYSNATIFKQSSVELSIRTHDAFFLQWKHIASAIKHELYERASLALMDIVSSNHISDSDIRDSKTVDDVLNKLKKKMNM
eukprot:361493_1